MPPPALAALPRSSNIPSIDDLRRYAVARSLFAPTTLPKAVARLGYVQADPIRAPARAQDLILRHRVRDYRAGDLERRYPRLDLEEDFFVNYGFVPRAVHALMHPRGERQPWDPLRWRQAEAVLAFVRARGEAHPDAVDAHFRHGTASNWFGGRSRASTQLLDAMHHRGLLRVVRRVSGTRVYAARVDSVDVVRQARGSGSQGAVPAGTAPAVACDARAVATLDALVDVAVRLYAPLPQATLHTLVNRLAVIVPQWAAGRHAALQRARERLAQAEVGGMRWFWPADENPRSQRHAGAEAPQVRLLAPFDPVVWDRLRFEQLWGWAYRFEAYTPAPLRQRGYYALPLLWRAQVIGWANAMLSEGRLVVQTGYAAGHAPREAGYRAALGIEAECLAASLGATLARVSLR